MLQCKLSQYVFGMYDYGRTCIFSLYDENDTVFDATGYTGVVQLFGESGVQMINDISVSWTSQTTGVGTWAFTSTLKPYTSGFLWLEVQLTKSGTELSTIPVRINIIKGPQA